MDSHSFLTTALIYLGVAVIAVPLFKRLGLGSVLGYLAAGSLIGPWGARLVTDPERIMQFSELGVVFLLFIIGLELKPQRLWVMRKVVFGLGSLQVFASGLILAGLLLIAGLNWVAALVAGLSLSLSSTAFALQVLGERKQLNTTFGKASFGILLLQDLAAIPLIGLVPFLGVSATASSQAWYVGAGKAIGMIVALVLAGRFLMQPVLRKVAAVKMQEIFTAATLFIVLGVALLMESVGLSMALGSFLAGVLLADSEHRHELEADIEPFKAMLLGLFFISVGMTVNFGLLLSKPFLVLGAVLGLLLVKSLVLYTLGILFGLKKPSARAMALTISQGGEFAFVVFGVAVVNQIIEKPLADLFTLVVTISMVMTPFLVMLNDYWEKKKTGDVPKFDEIQSEDNQVIIAGFGRFGQVIGRILRVRGIRFTALDHDQEQVNVLRKFGNKVYYGDATRLDLLTAAGAAKAKFFVLAIDNVEGSLQVARLLKQHFPNLTIFARARNRQHAYELLALGIQLIYRETFGTSLETVQDLLVRIGLDQFDAKDTVAKFKEHDERMLLEQFAIRHDENELINYSKQYAKQLSDLFHADQPRAEAPTNSKGLNA